MSARHQIPKSDLLRFRFSSGHVLSILMSVTPHFSYISDITTGNSSSLTGKIFRKKSMLENFCLNVLNTFVAYIN